MRPKFIIVNNGMTGLRGHYYETGVSVAAAAQNRGFETVMAAHASFDATALPSGVDIYPLFRVDHWGIKATTEAPGLFGLRGSLSALRKTTIEHVLSGAATMEQYLLSRFEPLAAPAAATTTTTSRRARIKHIAKRLVPPAAAPAARWLLRNRHHARRLARALISPFLYDRLKRLLRRMSPAASEAIDQSQSGALGSGAIAYDSRVEAHLYNALSRAGALQEIDFWPLFLRDLDRLLCLAGASAADHVYLPTAHGREVYAIRQLIEEIGEENSPTFHLELRHPVATPDELDSGCQDPGTLKYSRVHQAFFDACRSFPDSSRMRYYTDTEELAALYAQLTGFEFRVLPIPFRAELIPTPAPSLAQSGPLKVMFLGDVREEKGFLLLPGLVRSLFEDYVRTGRLRFVVQAGMHPDQFSVPLQDALADLDGFGAEYVELIGRDGFLDPNEYYDMLANSDIVLCPYLADVYRARSSGVLAEAIIAGKPTVVQEGSWLARQQQPGSGETFTDLASFAAAVRSICERYEEYKANAALVQAYWRQNHSPEKLLDCLIEPTGQMRSRAA